ncbi:hypothetical protein NM688_g163 [Phlebia brevispora]|uniref:Uncharacterized protein n=1 Tax=Phlebia brevispora TaxID=194682 RepID=A0ACC1TES6_9APHY|nr:hypothetical protein NM688_g163 [Phlebia brevispora]
MKFLAILAVLHIPFLQSPVPLFAAPLEALITRSNCRFHNNSSTVTPLVATSSPCMSLTDSAPSDFVIEPSQSNCSVNLFTEPDCSDGSLILTLPDHHVLFAFGWCGMEKLKFEALNVTSVYETRSHARLLKAKLSDPLRRSSPELFSSPSSLKAVRSDFDYRMLFSSHMYIMRLPTSSAAVSLSLLQCITASLAAPAGARRTPCSCARDLGPKNIEHVKQAGAACTSLTDSVPPGFSLDAAKSDCNVNLFTEPNCSGESLVQTISVSEYTADIWSVGGIMKALQSSIVRWEKFQTLFCPCLHGGHALVMKVFRPLRMRARMIIKTHDTIITALSDHHYGYSGFEFLTGPLTALDASRTYRRTSKRALSCRPFPASPIGIGRINLSRLIPSTKHWGVRNSQDSHLLISLHPAIHALPNRWLRFVGPPSQDQQFRGLRDYFCFVKILVEDDCPAESLTRSVPTMNLIAMRGCRPDALVERAKWNAGPLVDDLRSDVSLRNLSNQFDWALSVSSEELFRDLHLTCLHAASLIEVFVGIMKYPFFFTLRSFALLQYAAMTLGYSSCGRDDLHLRVIESADAVSTACTNVTTGTPSDLYVNTTQPGCSVNLFAEEGCPDGSLIHTVPSTALATRSWIIGHVSAVSRKPQFRADAVQCFLLETTLSVFFYLSQPVPFRKAHCRLLRSFFGHGMIGTRPVDLLLRDAYIRCEHVSIATTVTHVLSSEEKGRSAAPTGCAFSFVVFQLYIMQFQAILAIAGP